MGMQLASVVLCSGLPAEQGDPPCRPGSPHAQPNPESGAVVRQLPAEETLRIARAVECVQSMLVNQRG
jgi:hypothetical protein